MKIARKILFAFACLLLAAPALAAGYYTISADGTEVTDSRTGLIWRRCSEGQSWNGSTCAGSALTYTHEQALVHAQTQTGWRLPNVKELSSIVDLGVSNPAIDSVTFPGTVSNFYWSSSPYSGNANGAWNVSFDLGLVYGDGDRNYSDYVRLVR